MVLRYIGSSRDQRTNRWKVACPRCGHEWEPETTMRASQVLDCPKPKCDVQVIVNYNDRTVKELPRGAA